jgi:hypothetical protein
MPIEARPAHLAPKPNQQQAPEPWMLQEPPPKAKLASVTAAVATATGYEPPSPQQTKPQKAPTNSGAVITHTPAEHAIYVPRKPFLPYHLRSQRWAVIIAHRRSGKTVAVLNDMIVRALINRPDHLRQQFAFIAPSQAQCRANVWEYLKYYTHQFSKLKGYKISEQNLTITLPDPSDTNKYGSTIMLLGAENAERMRGLFLDGVVVDEGQLIPSYVIDSIIRPALADRQGWMTIAGTVNSPDDMLWRIRCRKRPIRPSSNAMCMR